MIRIDEIYTNTFGPWIQQHLPLTRMFFCDPPGQTDPSALMNQGEDVDEHNYIFFHDQEPIHLDIHKPLFDDVVRRNLDLNFNRGADHAIIITSEYQSEFVQKACDIYGWRDFYYFFHGWAALDWYRGYDKTFVIPPPEQRVISRSFLSANRIIGGRRDHRVVLMYHLLQNDIQNAWISFPRVCPVEGIEAASIAQRIDPGMKDTFDRADLPRCFPGESDHPMHSCWLSLFRENSECLAHVITETVFHGNRQHLTEKTFKPICLRMPFVMVSTAHSLEYLKRYGFKTFHTIWDESYDQETDDDQRLIKISRLLKDLDDQSPKELDRMYRAVWSIIEHNYQHFYSGGFEKILWTELTAMLSEIKYHVKHD